MSDKDPHKSLATSNNADQKDTQITPTSSSKATTDTKTNSSDQSNNQQAFKTYPLIWLDTGIDENKEPFRTYVTQLQAVTYMLKLFTNVTECLLYLEKMRTERFFILVSGSIGENMMPYINEMSSILAVFIFCKNKYRHEEWSASYPKVKKVSTSIKHICEAIIKTAQETDENANIINIVSRRMGLIIGSVPDENYVDTSRSAVMYRALLKDIIFTTDMDELKSFKDFLVYSRAKGFPDTEVKQLETRYKENSPIWWYTQRCFVHDMLYRAIHDIDMETIAKMGFFIRSIHQQLKELYNQQVHMFKEELIVYHAQKISQLDFKNLYDETGKIVIFNNFLSTTFKKETVIKYANDLLERENNVRVLLFVTKVNPSVMASSKIPFAIVDKFTATRIEQEVLFSMNTTFRFEDMKQSSTDSRIWELYLTSVDNNDPYLKTLTKDIDRYAGKCTGWYRMGELLIGTNNYTRAEELYNELLKHVPNELETANIYYQLGLIKEKTYNYQEAASLFENAINVYRKRSNSNEPIMLALYSRAAIIRNGFAQYTKAIEHYKDAIELLEKSKSSNQILLSDMYRKCAAVYNRMEKFTEALQFYEKSIAIKKSTISSDPSLLTHTYRSTAIVYMNMRDYSKAFELLNKAVEIDKENLPQHSADLATTYDYLTLIHSMISEYEKALEFQEKSLKLKQKMVPFNHPDIALCYHTIGELHEKLQNYTKAIEFYETDIQIMTTFLHANHTAFIVSFQDIGLAYEKMKNYSKAIEYLEKALAVCHGKFALPHPQVRFLQNHIDSLKKKM